MTHPVRGECGLAAPAGLGERPLARLRPSRRSLALEQLYRLAQFEIALSGTRGVIWIITRGEDTPAPVTHGRRYRPRLRLSRSS